MNDAGQKHKRKLSNVKLTQDFHFRYMGLWVLACTALIVATNLVLYFAIELHIIHLQDQSMEAFAHYEKLRTPIVIGLIAETILFSLAVAFLAVLTAHRAAGPFIRLKHVFDAVAQGDFSTRLKFRSYDKLEFLEEGFESMMKTVRSDRVREPSAAPTKADTACD